SFFLVSSARPLVLLALATRSPHPCRMEKWRLLHVFSALIAFAAIFVLERHRVAWLRAAHCGRVVVDRRCNAPNAPTERLSGYAQQSAISPRNRKRKHINACPRRTVRLREGHSSTKFFPCLWKVLSHGTPVCSRPPRRIVFLSPKASCTPPTRLLPVCLAFTPTAPNRSPLFLLLLVCGHLCGNSCARWPRLTTTTPIIRRPGNLTDPPP
ncbi:unnamed protein product, partial [Scytosiphon promiscuus]